MALEVVDLVLFSVPLTVRGLKNTRIDLAVKMNKFDVLNSFTASPVILFFCEPAILILEPNTHPRLP